MESTNYAVVFQMLAYSFVLVAGCVVIAIIWLYITDIRQTKHAIRHNFPVVGRLRYLFEHWGVFFRQYFFTNDREEMPFNRAQRSWVYRAAKDLDTTLAFGSSRDLNAPGSIVFANSIYSILDDKAIEPVKITIGSGTPKPYCTDKHFHISAMSYGAISAPAVKALSAGARAAGILLNTGEGGLSPYHLEGDCDVVFQIGTGKFGVRDNDGGFSEEKLQKIAAISNVKLFEIKLSQGAKPGKGGILPAAKVTDEISRIRGVQVGHAAISPNRFTEVQSPEDLVAMINKIRSVTNKPTGIKLCVGSLIEVEALFKTIIEQGKHTAPDFITVDSGDGGSGAAPMALIDNVGITVRESLPLVADLLERYELKDSVTLIASGKLINPADVAWALCAGADMVYSARGFMLALGCIQAMQCNQNTCPTGVTTHDEDLQQGLNPADKAVRVAKYAKNMEKEISVIAHSCGVDNPRLLRRHHARVVTEGGQSVPFG